jgi:hypothetical protein
MQGGEVRCLYAIDAIKK